MRALAGLLVAVLGLAACVPGSSGMAPMSHSCTTTIIGPDGKPQQAVIEADDAGAAAALCEGESAPRQAAPRQTAPLQPPLPKVAGVPQTMETQDLGGGFSVKTYTYGTPPSSARAKASAPVQSRPAPLAGNDSRIHRRVGVPGCGLKMVGGTAYVCASN